MDAVECMLRQAASNICSMGSSDSKSHKCQCTAMKCSPMMQPTMDTNFVLVNFSSSSTHDRPKVNKLEVEDKIVFEVMLVIERLKLNVNCAANHIGATCMTVLI